MRNANPSTSRRRVIAMIPARGGSKGIPGKNLHPLLGKPLIAYSIEAALDTPGISEVYVSTDDPHISNTAQHWGAKVIPRPAEHASDTATSEAALSHALETLLAQGEPEPDAVVFLQATSPLRQPDDIARALGHFFADRADSLFSACPAHGFVWRNEASGPSPLNYDPQQRPRRQDAPEDLVENGSIYIFKPWVLRELHSRLGGRIATHRMATFDSFQIDEPEDLDLMEFMLLRRQRPRAPELAQVRLLILDFDGVMTDNRVVVDQDGIEAVSCYRGDSIGIERLQAAGVEVMVLSTERNPVVTARCRKLRIPCLQGQDDKLTALRDIAANRGLSAEHIAYIGNDINDLACMRWVGLPITVADGMPEVRAVSRLVTTRKGGRGAVREASDWLVSAHSKPEKAA